MRLRKILLVSSLFAVTSVAVASSSIAKYCTVNDSIPTLIGFAVRYEDPTIPWPGPKSPVTPPSVSIDGHTLYLYSECAGATLQVVNTLGVAVYTEELYETTTEVELPEALLGEYELQIIRGNYCFYATIEL